MRHLWCGTRLGGRGAQRSKLCHFRLRGEQGERWLCRGLPADDRTVRTIGLALLLATSAGAQTLTGPDAAAVQRVWTRYLDSRQGHWSTRAGTPSADWVAD